MFFIFSRDDSTDTANITVFAPGQDKPLTADSTHPSFDRMVEGVKAGDPSVVDLFDIPATIVKHFDRLSDRVTTANGQLYLDGDVIENALAKNIMRFLDEGVHDWQPLVNFFEKVLSNPDEHSREQLYVWLERHDLTVTEDGDMVAYKGCRRGEDGILRSTRSGPAIVNGTPLNDYVPNEIGSVVEMQRSSVVHDPSIGCSVGLHVGTHNYAKDYARSGALLEVHVNPRDVVSVPTDCNAQKVRVARYKVIREIPTEGNGYESAVLPQNDIWGDF